MLSQTRSGVQHHGFARFEQKARQVAVGKGGVGSHLFNMLNEWGHAVTRVFTSLAVEFDPVLK
jgi:hypothetical protein